MSTRFVLPSGTGSITVVENAGRVAEIHPEPGGSNLLWRDDTFTGVAGGDRLWLAPEKDLFYKGDPALRSNWYCPEELDPGSWRANGLDGQVELEQTAMGASMTRRVHALNGLRIDPGLTWAGYRVEDRVVTSKPWSGWHLVMVPSPATLYVGTSRNPLEIFGPAPEPEGGWVEAGGETEWKLGFDPPPDGRLVMAGIGPADPGPAVVVVTTVPPDGTYVDLPSQGSGPATAVQLYDSPGLGFCEIEHHFPLETRTAIATVVGVWGSRQSRLDLVAGLSR